MAPGRPHTNPAASDDARGADGAEEPWYVSAFRGEYRSVYSHRDLPSARREVAWLADEILGAAHGRILDLCCGFGRHSLALRERGLDVVGIDLSADLLVGARELPGSERLLAGRLARADMRRLPFGRSAFGAVLNLFTSFGYLGEEGDREVLDELARVLAPGAVLVMDLMNAESVRAGLVPHSREERDGVVIEAHRALEDGGRRVTKDVVWHLPDGAVRRWREDVRMYEPAELDGLLGERGLAVERRVGDFDGGAYEGRSSRQIVVARRGG